MGEAISNFCEGMAKPFSTFLEKRVASGLKNDAISRAPLFKAVEGYIDI